MIPTIVHKVRCEAQAAILQIAPDAKDQLRQTGVVMEFTFDLTENNNASANGKKPPRNTNASPGNVPNGNTIANRRRPRSRHSTREPSAIPAT